MKVTPDELGYRRGQNRWRIREILSSQTMNMSKLARELGVSPQTVQATVRGRMHSPSVLDALREYGVPEDLLFDPRQERKTA